MSPNKANQGTTDPTKLPPREKLAYLEAKLKRLNQQQYARQNGLEGPTPEGTCDLVIGRTESQQKLEKKCEAIKKEIAILNAVLRPKTTEIKLSDVQDTSAPQTGSKRKASESIAQSAKLENAIQRPAKRQRTSTVATTPPESRAEVGEFKNNAFAQLLKGTR